ncbi:TLR cluster1 member 31 [Biomphalaria glabrata]|uniref:Toll-like receptor 4 n=1 Tax=Biomphalaria glabrata TaxID=6526 RepID=A0A9U8EHC0_BIOGL|nr:toll-like receptor 4 [Biomphalaria glabrata]KAI8746212.1 leucine-rich repeat-containing protein 4B-like [Biomphalaria glabrata]
MFILYRLVLFCLFSVSIYSSCDLKSEMLASGHFPKLDFTPCAIVNVTVDCSCLSLTDIQPSWFPSYTEVLLFNNNKLKVMPNYTFSHLQHLKILNLSKNDIQEIEIDAFHGLGELENVQLYQNKFCFNDSVKLDRIFQHTPSLTELNIIQNTDCDNVTNSFLTKLTKLRRLEIRYNSDRLYLGPEFTRLRDLKYLKIVGDAQIIDNLTFVYVGNLTGLELSIMNSLNSISSDAFQPLINLKSLRIIDISLNLSYVLSRLGPFQGRNMSEMTLDTISIDVHAERPREDGYLTRNNTQYLRNICVASLSLQNCRIYYITVDAVGGDQLETWNNCLVNLVISGNPLTGNRFALLKLVKLKQLKSVTMSDVFRSCVDYAQFPLHFEEHRLDSQSNGSISTAIEDKETPDHDVLNGLDTSTNVTCAKNHTASIDQRVQIGDSTHFYISENLRYINARRLVISSLVEDHFIIYGAHNAEYLDISDSGFKDFTGIVEGFTSLRTCILSGNDLSKVSIPFFEYLPSMENLALSNCRLERDFMSQHSHVLFKNLTRLRQLDLSSNSLNYLSKNTFLFNSHLQFVNLSRNLFREIPFTLRYTPELRALDLSVNSLSSIDISTTKDLDHHVTKTGYLKLYLQGNVLSCGCNDITFLQWMKTTLVTFDLNGNFTCINEKGERTYILFHSDLESLWRECNGILFLYLSVIIMCLYFIGLCIVFIIYRNKQFLISYLLQTFVGFKISTRKDYKIDVYIGYSDRDYKFPCKDLREFFENSLGYKTFLIDRDLIASVDKASGIVDALNASWRILLVCSESFLKEDDWSMFTMRSAIYTQSPANPARVVVLVHKDCLHLLPTTLIGSVNEEKIIVVSEWKINYEMKQKLTTHLSGDKI